MIKTYAYLDDKTTLVYTNNKCYKCGFTHSKHQHIRKHTIIDENHAWIGLRNYKGVHIHKQTPQKHTHQIPKLEIEQNITSEIL
ncbi:hypothetical protein CMI47_13265 [Candidatus Pacearchaeota archaeon]|nr:hypothetical protein [Candidatus Pacearchaeota archaeon]|tara:strand:+ start:3853 stop:4104 length:252 start_codon:yes stop_codon:yes gene_type:complete